VVGGIEGWHDGGGMDVYDMDRWIDKTACVEFIGSID
jgi:hypothetical protein